MNIWNRARYIIWAWSCYCKWTLIVYRKYSWGKLWRVQETTISEWDDEVVYVSMSEPNAHWGFAKDKVMICAKRKYITLTDLQEASTAYHGTGDELVAWCFSASCPMHIIPPGRAAVTKPFLVTRKKLKADIVITLGGRIADKINYRCLWRY